MLQPATTELLLPWEYWLPGNVEYQKMRSGPTPRLQALELVKYTVKTVYGTSIENYDGTELEPLFGTGRGSGASPAVWLSLVVILLHTIDRIIPEQMEFSTPNGKIHHERLTDAYVDDSSLGLTGHAKTFEYEGLIRRLQEVAQTWSDLFESSGGSLNFKKAPGTSSTGKLNLRTQTSDFNLSAPTKKARNDHQETQKILGVYITPTNNSTAQLLHYKHKADTFATRLKAKDIRIFHRLIYISTMRYRLTTTAVQNVEDLQPVQSRVIASMLQKMHMSSKLPTPIRHGSRALGGLEM